ncbi:hypothetical protein BDW69DRAFT_47151 [Aspergillus filifer]
MDLSLIESSRFLNMEWKRFAICQAEELTTGIVDSYTHSCLVQRKCILHRLSGELDLASSILPDVAPAHLKHATVGHILIQGALNHIRRDELSKAKDLLENWRPIRQLLAIEEIVLFLRILFSARFSAIKANSQDYYHASRYRVTLQKSRKASLSMKTHVNWPVISPIHISSWRSPQRPKYVSALRQNTNNQNRLRWSF